MASLDVSAAQFAKRVCPHRRKMIQGSAMPKKIMFLTMKRKGNDLCEDVVDYSHMRKILCALVKLDSVTVYGVRVGSGVQVCDKRKCPHFGCG